MYQIFVNILLRQPKNTTSIGNGPMDKWAPPNLVFGQTKALLKVYSLKDQIPSQCCANAFPLLKNKKEKKRKRDFKKSKIYPKIYPNIYTTLITNKSYSIQWHLITLNDLIICLKSAILPDFTKPSV